MVAATFVLTTLAVLGSALADWKLIVLYSGTDNVYKKNGLTNSGCTKLPNKGYWATWFDYTENSYTDTVCFYNHDDCTGTKWCYHERDSGNVGALDFRSYKIY